MPDLLSKVEAPEDFANQAHPLKYPAKFICRLPLGDASSALIGARLAAKNHLCISGCVPSESLLMAPSLTFPLSRMSFSGLACKVLLHVFEAATSELRDSARRDTGCEDSLAAFTRFLLLASKGNRPECLATPLAAHNAVC